MPSSKSAFFPFVQQVACEEPFMTAQCCRNHWGLRCRQEDGVNVWDRSKYGRHNTEGSSKGSREEEEEQEAAKVWRLVKRLPPQVCRWSQRKVKNQQTTRFLCWLIRTRLVENSLIRTVFPVVSQGSPEDEWRFSPAPLSAWSAESRHLCTWMGHGSWVRVG